MEEWTISKSVGKCAGTGKIIEPGEEYFAALVETEQGLIRQDFSAQSWNDSKPAVYCFWKTKMPRPDQKKKIFVDDDMLFSFFERLASETDMERLNFRFVLTLILMRKRKLKYDSTRTEDGHEFWRLRITGTEQYVDVLNPHLDQNQVEQLSGQLSQILQADL
jgi:hypothetical protein